MVPVNGSVGKPLKTIARPPNKPIIPVLPLNFPQRPAANKQSSAPTDTSPPKTIQNGIRPTEDKTEPRVAATSQGAPSGNSTKLSSGSIDNRDIAAPSAPPFQVEAKAEPVSNTEIFDERDKGMF